MGAFVHLIISFLVEELRLRSSFSPAFSLVLFPQLILMGSLAGYLFHPYLIGEFSASDIHFSVCAGLFIFGTTMGSMAFLGREFIERSIGPVTMLAASVNYQPVSDRRMFTAYYLHDALFFLILVLIPIGAGVALGTIVHAMPLHRLLLIIAAYWSCFYLGLSLSMSLSACLTNGRKAYLLLILLLPLPLIALMAATGDPRAFAASYLALSGGDPIWLAMTVVLILFYSFKGALLFDGSSYSSGREGPWSYSKALALSARFGSRNPPLMAREMLNLIRGRAYLAMAFSLLVPVIVMIALVGILQRVNGVEMGLNSVFISVTVSIFTISVYTNLVNTDDPDFDQTIPADAPGIIKEKLRLHLFIAIPLSIAIVALLALLTDDIAGLLIALPVCISTVIYMGCVTAYLTGIWTNSLLFNSAVFIQYIFFTILPIVCAGSLAYLMGIDPWLAGAGSFLYVALTLSASKILGSGIERKWRDQVLKSGGLG
ncbi:MAG: hypothetical protein QCI82_00615 [Candidatus Thermoplasmatota archaeon]|nr:hypothetical protein [Candidatus Thermoplasmatota archaeon]